MKKSVYFIIQIIWSVVVSSVIWFLTLRNASFDFYGNSDDSLMVLILCAGAALYLILTIFQIVVGIRKVEGWRWWFLLISLLISVAMVFIGEFAAVYGSEFLNKIYHMLKTEIYTMSEHKCYSPFFV